MCEKEKINSHQDKLNADVEFNVEKDILFYSEFYFLLNLYQINPICTKLI